jgi:hypothetical protein
MKLINFFLVKKAYNVQRQDFSKNLFENCAFYGLDTGPEPKPEPEPKPYKNF